MKAFGKYQLLEEIGNGPAGTTYRAHDTFLDTGLAVKVLRSAALPTAKKQFCQQLAACAELQHPHIAKVHDLGEVEGSIYIATELLAGADLRRRLREGVALTLAQKLKLVAQICDGLAFAHRHGTAHGNIKPSNIFITENREAKILDFGMARWAMSIEMPGAQPAPLPNYLAPEQILNQSFDARSDLFSVGILLYELIAGVYPFQVSAALIPREIVHAEPERLRKLDPQIPEELECLLLRALDKDPRRRLQSADEFAVCLCAIARQLEPEAVPASEISTLPLPVGPSITAVTASAEGANPRVGVATLLAPPANSGRSMGPGTVPSPRRLLGLLAAAAIGIVILAALLSRQSTIASPAKIQSQANPPSSALPSPKQDGPPQSPVVEIQKPLAATATPEPQPRPEQILRGPVASFWEAGQYAQAMKLVDEILADDPSHAEARAWKTKIRAAQDAEADIK